MAKTAASGSLEVEGPYRSLVLKRRLRVPAADEADIKASVSREQRPQQYAKMLYGGALLNALNALNAAEGQTLPVARSPVVRMALWRPRVVRKASGRTQRPPHLQSSTGRASTGGRLLERIQSIFPAPLATFGAPNGVLAEIAKALPGETPPPRRDDGAAPRWERPGRSFGARTAESARGCARGAPWLEASPSRGSQKTPFSAQVSLDDKPVDTASPPSCALCRGKRARGRQRGLAGRLERQPTFSTDVFNGRFQTDVFKRTFSKRTFSTDFFNGRAFCKGRRSREGPILGQGSSFAVVAPPRRPTDAAP
ncbi:hypothetical protein M885DRAFT_515874 [Pelagophyceae sp. CCMP2097]|nr:hypothetical protein M885DRAFT_515874 [Pelagophyceae sp. CCMP2097]